MGETRDVGIVGIVGHVGHGRACVGIVGVVGHAKTGVGVVGIVRIVGTAIGNHALPVVPPMSRIYKSCDKIRQWSTTTRTLRSISCLGTTQ